MSISGPKDTHPSDELWSPETSPLFEKDEITQGSSTLQVHNANFICTDCEQRISVPGTLFMAQPFTTHCPNCDRPISVQLVHSDSQMEVVELSGCEYSAAVSALPGLQKITQTEQPSLISRETFIDELVATWHVETRGGESLTFAYFSALREAVLSGQVTGQDKVLAPDGRKCRVDQYPGTADLFGNAVRRAEAQRHLGPDVRRPFPLVRWIGLLSRAVFLTALAASVAAGAVYGPRVHRWWKLRDGARLVSQITASVKVNPAGNVETLLAQGRHNLRQDEPEFLPEAAARFLQALALAPRDVRAVAGLAETWIESGAVTGNSLDREKAERLTRYAETLAPGSFDAVRTRVRQLWKSGRREEAIAHLESRTDLLASDPASQVLLARMAMESGDYSKATIHLNEALQKEPGNASYLLTFADLFEQQGKFLEAASYLQRAARASDRPEEFTSRLAGIYRNAGDLAAAKALYRKVLGGPEPKEEDRFRLIEVLAQEQKMDEVAAEARTYFVQFPDGAYFRNVETMRDAAMAALTGSSEKKDSKAASKNRSSRRFSRRSRSHM